MLLKVKSAGKRIVNQGLSFLLILSFIFTMSFEFGIPAKAAEPVGNWADYAVEVVPVDKVYTIHTAEELAWIAKIVNGGNTLEGDTVELASDIDLSNHYWEPIANFNKNFSGVFNGNRHSITGMGISTNADDNVGVGLFGVTYQATIRDVTVKAESIEAKGSQAVYVGVLCGSNVAGRIVNCNTSGRIVLKASKNGHAGGIVGENGGTIMNCLSTADIECMNEQIETLYIGGFAGYNYSYISNCAAAGTILEGGSTTLALVGGFTGFFNNGTIINSYAAEHIAASNNQQQYVGAFTGNIAPKVYTKSCYWLKDIGSDISGVNSGSDCIDLRVEQLQNKSIIGSGTYSKYKIVDALNTVANTIPDAKKWKVVSGVNNGYPIFEDQATDDDEPSTNMPTIKQIYTGENHTFALCEDGTLWAWGNNAEGQLGIGSNGDKSKPTQITGIGKVKSVEAGHNHTFIICEDGSVWTWGKNDHGQLGVGNTQNQFKPVRLQ